MVTKEQRRGERRRRKRLNAVDAPPEYVDRIRGSVTKYFLDRLGSVCVGGRVPLQRGGGGRRKRGGLSLSALDFDAEQINAEDTLEYIAQV